MHATPGCSWTERWLVIALTLLYAGGSVAHHAEREFDRGQTLSATGVVKEYLWANPHVLIYLEGADASGRVDVAVFESGAATFMKRSGWSRDTLRVGEHLTVTYHPRRDHRAGGMFVAAVRADGTELRWPPATAP